MDTEITARRADGVAANLPAWTGIARPTDRSPALRHNRKSLSFLVFLLALWIAAPAAAPETVRAEPRGVPGAIDPPTVTLGVPATVTIGSDVAFTVTFDNNDPEFEIGFGPFVELHIPVTGADGAGAEVDDGLGTATISASFMGSPIPAQDFYRVTFDAAGNAAHPIVRDTGGNYINVTGTPGDELVVIRLPFGSFTYNQPPATVDMTVNMSNLADIGAPLEIRARGGYEFGYTSLDDWCCGDPPEDTLSGYTAASVTPTLLELAKAYIGPSDLSDETTTGPHYTRQYALAADIAPGQTIADLRIIDRLPDNEQFVSLDAATPGYFVEDQPVAGSAQYPPNNDLIVYWSAVTGGPGAADAEVQFSFFVTLEDAGGSRVIEATDGMAVTSCNQALLTGEWTPVDTRDDPQSIAVDPAGCEHVLTDRSLAVQKHIANPSANYHPGYVLDYQLDIQVSDFFAFDQVVLTDVLSDGQHFDPSFTPTLEVDGNGYILAAAGFNAANYTVDESNIDLLDGPPPPPAENPATDGTTIITFEISDEIILRGRSGRLIGGCVDPVSGSPVPDCSYDDGATTAVIHFHAVIQEDFTDVYPSGDWSVDQGDTFRDDARVESRLLDTGTLLPAAGPVIVEDDAEETFDIGAGELSKSIYAVNGSTSFPSPVEIKPGDEVTYRITYTMPTSDEENLEFWDYLPLPIFFVADPDADDYPGHSNGPVWVFDAVGQSGQPAIIPASGHANFGPADTFFDYSGIVPALTADAGGNYLDFYYGDFDDPASQPNTVDFLFTVTVATEPFADGLYLTNQVHAEEGSTNAGDVPSDEIIPLILTEPVLTSSKGVIWTSNPSNVFDPADRGPAGVTFLAPGSAPRWTGTIHSAGLAARPVDSDVRDVDAGDTVTFAITIENTGSSLNGAFDIRIQDILQTQYQIPGTGLNLQVYYGDTSGPIPYHGLTSSCAAAGDNDPCGEEIFQDGIELDDPVGAGVCSAHDPNLGNNVIVITYDLEIRIGVTPGDIVNTETLLSYAGDEGGPNHVPSPSPIFDDATVTISGAPEKYIVSTSEAHTGFSGVDLVAVGEVIRYRIAARIPESTSENYQLRDLLPNGLLFLDDGTAQIAFVSNGGIASAGRDSIPAIPPGCNLTGTAADAATPAALPCLLDDWNVGSSGSTTGDPDVYGNGSDVYFKFGDLTNGDLDDDGEFVVVEFNALVHNLTADQNDSGDTRSNRVRAYAGRPLLQIGNDSAPLTVRVVEPFLTLDKTHSAMGLTVDAGDTVTYTATITNDGGTPTNSTATAFDIEFTDTPPAAYLTLNLASVAFSTSGGAAGVVNASAGNTVRFTIASMPVGGQVVITYQVNVSAAVTPGQAIDNDAEVVWTSLPGTQGTGDAAPGLPGEGNGERDGSDGPTGNPNDHDRTDVATLDVREPVFSKSLEATSAAHTAGNNLAIGEVATFGLVVTLPEGTIPGGFRVEDEIPDGLSYVDGSMLLVTQTSPPAGCGSLAADFNGTLPAPTLTVTPPGGGSGADLAFDFGPTTVTGDNNTDNNSFLICFSAVLLNEAGNQASPPPLTNVGHLVLGTDVFTDDLDVDIVEPTLQIAKSVDDPNPTPGQIVTFTVVVNHAPSSGADAFDVEISDSLPADLALDTASIAISPSGGLVNVVNGSAGNLVYVSVDAFPLGGSLTITYSASVNASFGTTINNTAGTVWTSLPGPESEERTGADGPGGALNDYADGAAVPLVSNRDLVKSLVGDSHPAPVTALPNVTIGEILTYQLVITIPPSSSDTYAVVDTLDTGLAFVDCETITGGPDLTSSTVSLNAAGNCVPGTGGGSNPLISDAGATVAFDLGTVVNADAVAAESITIRYRAVVLDTTANVGGVELRNEVRMDWSLGTISRETSPVTIIEPDLGMEKTVDTPSATPYTILTYQIRIFHTGSSELPAYDAVINDILPDNIVYVPGSLAFMVGSGVAPTLLDDTAVDPVSGNPMMRAVWDVLPLGGESTIQFQAELQPINMGVVVTNTASAEWTSLPGEVPSPPAAYLSDFDQVYSHERRYDPLFPADIYRVSDSATVTHPLLPDTGFAPGRITGLPVAPDEPHVRLDGVRLYIPRLGRSLPVVGIPLGEDGWDLTWLWDQAGYLEGTAFPGSSGNSIITAHVYLPNGQTGPFAGLGSLRWGDALILRMNGQRIVYEVRTNTSVLPTDIAPFRHEDTPWLTLVTCLGYDPWSDTYRYRQVVRAVLVDVS